MNRRLFISGAGALALVGGSVSAQTANTCIVMEEREGAFVIEGTGDLVTEPTSLDAGTFRVEVSLNAPTSRDGLLRINFYTREDGEKDETLLFTDRDGLQEFSSGIAKLSGGEYVIEVQHFPGDWKVVLSPI